MTVQQGTIQDLRIRRRRNKIVKYRERFFSYTGIIVVCIIIGFPLYWMLITSLQTQNRLLTFPPAFWVHPIEIKAYKDVVTNYPIWQWLRNSIFVSLFSVLFAMLFSVLCGYSLSRFRYRGRKFISMMILLTQMLPSTLIIIPIYIIFRNAKLLDSFWGLILSNSTHAIPLCTWTLKGYFDTIPKELEDAAIVDGCNQWDVLFRIMLPMAVPACVAAAIISFFGAWNEYAFAVTFISDPQKWLTTIGLASFMGDMYTPWDQVMAGAFLCTVPAIVIFIILQRYIVSGLTSGAIKE